MTYLVAVGDRFLPDTRFPTSDPHLLVRLTRHLMRATNQGRRATDRKGSEIGRNRIATPCNRTRIADGGLIELNERYKMHKY